MRRLSVPVALLVAVLVTGTCTLALLGTRQAPGADTARINDVVQRLAAAWPHPEAAGLDGMADALRVVDAAGAPVPLGPGAAPVGYRGLGVMQWTGEHRPLTSPVVVDGRIVAWAWLDDGYTTAVAAHQRALTRAGTATLVLTLVLVLALVGWLGARVLLPFKRLERFAARVAGGDLSAPLEMDRANAFGAWTQSFDLLRTELAASRQREADAQASKEALIAQIGHDLRTPVATICATAELLQLTEDSPARERLEVVRSKGHQVDALISDLFRAHSSQVDALSVSPADLSSREVVALVRQADHRQLVEATDLPQVLVRADRLRLAQVIDNVVQNSYKYAGTPIRLTGGLETDCLRLVLTDAGPGVAPDETSLIFARGQRGRGAVGVPGQGLGLFTCAQLMERMGGHIEASLPGTGGLAITLYLPLA